MYWNSSRCFSHNYPFSRWPPLQKILKIGDELQIEYLPNYSAANLDRELTHIVNNIFSMKCYKINVPRRFILVSTPRF